MMGYPLVRDIWPNAVLNCGYLLMVLVGPLIMRSFKAFNLQRLLIFYNFIMVGISGYILFEVRKKSQMEMRRYTVTCCYKYKTDESGQRYWGFEGGWGQNSEPRCLGGRERLKMLQGFYRAIFAKIVFSS